MAPPSCVLGVGQFQETTGVGAVQLSTKNGTPPLGRPYDLYFEWSDDRIYCSELVWKVYKNALGIEIGVLQRLGDFNLADPVVAAKLEERFGDAVPKDEVVISPASMFRSDKLRTVYEQ